MSNVLPTNKTHNWVIGEKRHDHMVRDCRGGSYTSMGIVLHNLQGEVIERLQTCCFLTAENSQCYGHWYVDENMKLWQVEVDYDYMEDFDAKG